MPPRTVNGPGRAGRPRPGWPAPAGLAGVRRR